jgi:DNA gyrase subunit B
VNALSEWLDAEVFRDGQIHHMRFERGQTVRQLETLGKTERRGTKISFKPDAEIFKQTQEFKFEKIAKRLRELAYLNAGIKITLRDERVEGKVEEYCFPNGVVDFVSDLSGGETVLLSKPIYLKGSQESEESKGRVEVEIAVQYNDTYADSIVSYVNNINTIDGGTHETGFRTALTTTLNNYIKENEKAGGKEEERPTGDDYREGLVAVISVKVPEPQFEGQTKGKLGNSDVAGIVQNVVGEFFKAWLEHHPAETKRIINKARQARDARLAAKKAKELVRKTKDALRGGGIAKLKDCESTNPDECELFLVEGDSAGGTACEGRDPRTQAILPLRGKILNVWKSTHEKMLEHNEIANIIQALGTGILDDFDIKKCQFGKVIIMCDADVDGSHIRTLILTFFFRQMPDLIKNGHVFCAQPPLYKITFKGKRAKKDSAGEVEGRRRRGRDRGAGGRRAGAEGQEEARADEEAGPRALHPQRRGLREDHARARARRHEPRAPRREDAHLERQPR